MIRALLIYAATVTTALVAVTLALGVPFAWVAWPVLAVELAIAATWGGVRIARHMKRQARQTWTYTRQAPRLPVTRVTAELVAPPARICVQPPALNLLEAPRRELTK
jgi:hypothetical protein